MEIRDAREVAFSAGERGTIGRATSVRVTPSACGLRLGARRMFALRVNRFFLHSDFGSWSMRLRLLVHRIIVLSRLHDLPKKRKVHTNESFRCDEKERKKKSETKWIALYKYFPLLHPPKLHRHAVKPPKHLLTLFKTKNLPIKKIRRLATTEPDSRSSANTRRSLTLNKLYRRQTRCC